ncbi:DeoR/GlpR family DNA-binding transcription regulator [Acinetobacter rudis]|uniref:HTH deoR-type domain-containing protein n=1 Tax=Acinetobacter rudis CIP 110305 TaxID=421052 RepID=S3NKF9_9GAMM|nr:DeoR/GlpR family DNA-binding transcription regulator [Acinetobacter rudis]EPF74704.1 hypothetical protein F945_01472 [Acinetobacter rudis CIP 110305]
MLQQERFHRIQALLSQLQRLSTERVMSELNISRETARRDIIELEALGLAKRVHGGIISIEPTSEAPLTIRTTQRAKEKRAIARTAIQQLSAGQTVFIDSGSTTSIVAEELRTLSGLTIITNSLHVVMNLTMAMETETLNHEIILLGGRVHQRPQTQGDLVIREIYRYKADIALLSPVGVCPQHGISSFYTEEANIAQAMVQQSQKVIVLADHSKLDITSRVQYATAQEIALLITDQQAKQQIALAKYKHAFSEVVFA